MVSAALVAQREVDEKPATATAPSGDGTEPVAAGLDTEQREAEPSSKGNPKTTARKKVM